MARVSDRGRWRLALELVEAGLVTGEACWELMVRDIEEMPEMSYHDPPPRRRRGRE